MEKSKITKKPKIFNYAILALCAALTCCSVLAFTTLFGGDKNTAQAAGNGFTWDNSAITTDFKKGGAQYNLSTGAVATGTYASNEAAWNAAIQYSINTGKRAKFTLVENWTATAATIGGVATTQFGNPSGVGIDTSGALLVPAKAKIQLNLNGHTIDRNLYRPSANGAATANLPLATSKSQPVEYGAVIYAVAGTSSTSGTAANRDNQTTRPQLEVTDSTATSGYDVKDNGIFKKGTTTLATGMIRGGCAAYANMGGGIYGWGSEIRITSGLIAYNYCAARGGAICVVSKNNVYMTGGALAYNVAGNQGDEGLGGGIYLTGSSFFPETQGGVISHNYSNSIGGGIYLAQGGNVILNLNASSGSGMQILSNYAKNNGGGIFCNRGSGVQLGLCKISGNIAGRTGGGIWLHADSFVPEVRGNPYVLGNATTAGVASNLYFTGTKKIKVTSKLTKNASPQIGVFMENLGVFTQSFVSVQGSGETASDYFVSDNANYTVNINKGVEGSLILLNSYEAKWNAAVNTSMKNSGAEVAFDMNSVSSLTNWVASNGKFGTGIGFESTGALLVPAGANIKINLKTFAINRNLTAPTVNGYVIKVLGTLTVTGSSTRNDSNGTITGGMITGGYSGNDGSDYTKSVTGGVWVGSGATLNLQSGAIYNNKGDNGQSGHHDGGVGIYGYRAKINISGGYVTKNVLTRAGSSIDAIGILLNASVLTMTGGEVSWNESKANTNHSHCAGIYVFGGSTMNMSGGVIKKNISPATGGGIRLGGTFNMTGGQIIENTAGAGNVGSGGGIIICSSAAVINLSGNIKIANNKGLGSNNSDDIQWQANVTIPLNITGALNTASRIGLDINRVTGAVNPVYTSGLKTKGGITTPSTVFYSNNPEYGITANSAGEAMLVKLTDYASIWKAAVTTSKNTGGLPVDFSLSLNKSWEATGGSFGTDTSCFENGALLVPAGANININLNGYKIDRKLTAAKANGYVLAVRGTCTVSDSANTTVNSSGALVPASGKAGGAITGGFNNSVNVPGGVFVAGSATLNLKSGCIWGNKSANTGNRGGVGVFVNTNGTLNMTGGYISNNVTVGAQGTDGGLDGFAVDLLGTFNMSGGEISYNKSTQGRSSNGIIAVNANSTFKMTGGTIKNNSTNGNNGGVYGVGGTITLSGNVNISGNIEKAASDSTGCDILVANANSVIKIAGKVTSSTPIAVRFGVDSKEYGAITSGAGKAGMTITDIRKAFKAVDETQIIGGTGSGTSLEGYIGTAVTALAVSNKTYNGANQTLISNFDSAKVTATLAYDGGAASAVTVVTGKDAGSYKYVFTLKEGYVWNDSALNYSADRSVTKTLTATMAKKTITGITDVVFNDKVYDGTTTATIDNTTGATFAGIVSGDNLTIASATSINFADKNFGRYKNVVVTGITLGGTSAKNYTIAATTQATGTAGIMQKSITAVTGITVNNKVYDGNVNATLGKKTSAAGVVFTGMVAGDSLEIASASVTFADKNAGTGKAVTVTGITLGGTDGGNYSILNTVNAYATGTTKATANITKKAITGITGVSYNDKTYDGTTTATFDGANTAATFAGKVSGDSLGIASATNIDFDNKNVGAGKTVTATGITLNGADAGNYSIAASVAATGTADITALALTSGTTITVSGTYTYTGSALTPTYTVTNSGLATTSKNLAANTDFTASYSNATNSGTTTAGDLTNAGTVTVTVTGKGNFSGTATQTFVINKAAITAYTWDSTSFNYDGNAKQPKIATVTTAAQNGLPANVADMFDYTGGTAENGTHTATAALKSDYAANYEISGASDKKTVTTSFTIALATLAVTATAYVGTYDGKKHKILTAMPTATGENLENNNLKWYYSTTNLGANDAGWINFVAEAGLPDVINVSDSATYYFKVTADNHTTELFSRGATVNAKSLGNGGETPADGITIGAIGSYTYDGTEHTPEPAVSDANATITANDYSYSYQNNKVAGVKTAVLTITGKGNYTGSVQVLYSIDERDIGQTDITVTGIADKTFNNSAQKLSPELNDGGINPAAQLAENVDYTVSYSRDGGSTATADFKNAGTITVTITGKGNYKGTRTLTYKIKPYDLSGAGAVTFATIANLTYNATSQTPEPAITVILGGSTVTLVEGTDFEYSYSDNLNAGTATVTVTGKGNYTLSASENFTIEQKLISSISGITADGKVYDGTDGYENAKQQNGSEDAAEIHFGNAVLSGNLDGSNLTVATATGKFSDKNAGTGKTVTVTVTALGGSAAGNYKLPSGGVQVTATPENGDSIDIVAREIEISWAWTTYPYDGKPHYPTATVGNLCEGDNVTLTTGVVGEVSPVLPNVTFTAEVTGVNNNEAGNYVLPAVKTTTFQITTENTSAKVDPDTLTVTFDGSAKQPDMLELGEDGNFVKITGNEDNSKYKFTFKDSTGAALTGAPVNAGTYTLTVWISPAYSWSDGYQNAERDYTFVISPATVTGMTLGGDTVTYNGSNFSLALDWSNAMVDGVLKGSQPDGVTVVYLYNGAAASGIAGAGTHTVTARFTVDGNYNAIADITATLVIEKAELDLDAPEYGVSFADGSASFTGDKHKLEITGTLPSGVSVRYSYVKDGVNFGSDGVSAVGEYTVTATFSFDNAADADNYKIVKGGSEISSLTAKLTVRRQSATVSGIVFEDGRATYDGNVHRLQVSGDAEGVTGVTYEYRKNGVLVGTDGVKEAGEYTVTAKFTVDPNYDASSAPDITKTLVIEKAPLTVTANDKTIVYGDNPATAGYTATYSGLVAGDKESDLGSLTLRVNGSVYAIYGDAGVYSGAIEASGLSGAAAANYDITYVAGTLTVKQRVITVTWYNDSNRTLRDLSYTYAAGVTHTPYADVTNTVNGDSVTVTVTGGQINAGVNYVAKATAVSNPNYTLPVNGLETTFEILPQPKNGVILWDNSTLYYNGKEQKPKAYYYENENDNSPKELTVTADRRSVNAGNYVATASFDGNYTLTGEKTKNFTIEKRKVFIEIGDMTASLGNVDVSGVSWQYFAGSLQFADGEVYSLNFTCGNVTEAGTYPIFGSFSSNNAANYEVTFIGNYTSADENNGKCGVLTVTAGAYDMSGVKFGGTEVTYDGTAHKITVSGLPAGVTASLNYTLNGWSLGNVGAVDAGEYKVIVSFTGSDEGYKNIPDVTVNLTVKKASLTVKANDKTIVYGDAPADGGVVYMLGGVEVAGIESELEGSLTLNSGYSQYDNAGKYKIVPAGLTAKNYEIVYVPGNLTVSPREITVTWYSDNTASASGTSFVYDYDGAVHTPYAVATGTLKGDVVTLTVAVDGGDKSQAGLNYTARITAVSNENYCVKEADSSVKFSIIEKNVIVWDNSSLEYDGTAQAPEAKYFDADGNEHTLTVEVRNEAGGVISAVNAGSYTAYVTDAPNGVTGDVSHSFAISPKAVTVTVGNGTLTYGEVEGSFLENLLNGLKDSLGGKDGFIAADGIPVTLECNVTNASNAGAYVITGYADGANKDNYVITVISGTLTIQKADVDTSGIIFDGVSQTVEYDGRAHAVTVQGTLPAGITGVTYTYTKNGNPVSESEVIAAGRYEVTAHFTVDANHNPVTGTFKATLEITAAELGVNISFAGDAVTYDGKQHSVYVTGDMTGVTGVTYEYRNASGAVVSNTGVKDAGTYTVSVTVTVAENYKPVTLASVQLVINKAKLTVTANNGSVVYGTAPSAGGYGYTVFGLALGDDADAVLGTLNYTYGTVAGVGEYTITVTGATSTDNYNVTYKNGKLTVTPYTLTAEDISWFDKQGGTALGESGKFTYVYLAGTEHKPYAEAVGLVNGETVTLTVSGGKINSGYGYVAEITGISGSAAGNYVLPAEGLKVTFDIVPRPLNGKIVWSEEPLYYNGTAQAPRVFYYDADGNEYEFTKVTVDREAVHAGKYVASVSIDDINFTLTGDTTKTFEILARPVIIEIGDVRLQYGEAFNPSAVSWSYRAGSLTFVGTDTYSITFSCAAAAEVGEYAIEGRFICGNPDDYKVTFTGSFASAGADNGRYGTLKVVKAVYDTSKITFAGTSVTYDGTKHKLVINGLPEGLTAVCTYVKGGFGYGVDGVKDAGEYTVTVSFTGDGNHEPVENMTATLTVKKASLTVKANDNTIIYGDAPSANGVTYSGFVNGEDENTLNALVGGLTYTYDYQQGGNVGDYTIIPAGLDSANYSITFKAGTLTVAPRTVTVSWYDDETMASQTFIYINDGQYHAPYAVAGGLVNGDAVVLKVEGAKRAQGINYVATAVLEDPNYALPTDGTATQKFTVTAKAGSIVWDNSPLYYNGAAQTPGAYYFDEQGVMHAITGVTVQGGDAISAGDYTAVVYFDGENRYCPFTILPLEVTIIIKNPSAVIEYGNAIDLDQSGWDYAVGSNRFISGSPVRLSTSAVAGSPAGKYAITGICTSANYKVTFVEGTLTVCKANIDISGLDYGILDTGAVYDGNIHSVIVSNLPAGIASVTVTYEKDGVSYGTEGVREAGVYSLTISFTLSDGTNYNLVGDVHKTFVITAKTADMSGVTFDNVTDAVYDGTAKHVLVSGSAEGVTGVTYTYYESDGTTLVTGNEAVNAGTYKVKAEFTFSSNYNGSAVAPMWAELTVNKATLTVTAGDGSVAYGETSVNANAFGYKVEGLASRDSESSVLGTVTLDCAGYASTLSVGVYAGYIGVNCNTSHANYVINAVSGDLTVTPREITVTAWQKSETDASADLEYVYAAGATYIPYAVAGNVANGDVLILKVETAKEPVGDGYVATVTGIYNADGVTENENYTLPAQGLTVNFKVKYDNPVSYEIIWNYDSLYYNGDAQKPSASYYDDVVGDFVNIDTSKIETYDMNGNPVQAIAAGTYKAKVTDTSTPFTNADQEMTFTVSPRKVYITVGDASGKYGESHIVSGANWTYASADKEHRFLDGDSYTLTLKTEANSSSSVGEYAIRAEFGDNANYEVIFTGGSWASADSDNGKCGTFTVEKAVLDLSKVTVNGTTAVYDGTAHFVTVDNLPAGVTANVTYTKDGWNFNGAVHAGEYLVTVSFNAGANYEPAADKTVTLSVAKAQLTVTANPFEIEYGDEPSANGVSYSGFAAGDSESKAGVLNGAVSYEFGYVKGGDAGVYKITPKGLTADDYEITFVQGNLTVKKRVVSVIWFNDERMNSQTLKYNCDGGTYLPYAEVTNVVAGDSVTLTVTGAQSAAGVNYRAEITAVSNPNYTLPSGGISVSFDIIPEAYVIVWETAPFVYDGTTQKPRAYYFTADGEQVELNVSVKPNFGASDSSGSSVYAGNYMAVASLKGGNVTLTGEFEHSYTIQKRKVTVVIKDSSSAYGEEISLAGWDIADGSEGFVSGAPVFLSTTATKSSNVGTYPITGVYAGSDNSYDVTFVNGVYTVEKALAPVPVITSKEYTGSLLKADVFDNAVYRVYQNDGGIRAGKYKVILELRDYDNYKWNVDGEDVRSANYTLVFEITKAENSLTTEFVAREIKAGGQINITAPVSRFGTAKVEYFKDADCTEKVNITGNVWGEVEGTYYAKVTVAETSNYGGIEKIYTFTVTGKLSLALYWGDLDHEYDGTVWTPKAYVMLDGKQIELKVTGGQSQAGVYNATVTLAAVDGTDLSKYEFSTGAGSAQTTVKYTINPKEIVVRIADVESVYGAALIDVDAFNADRFVIDGTLVGTDNRNSLKITFTCDFGTLTITPAGKYAIKGSCGNANYKVVFEGSMGTAGTYTVKEATIKVLKNETTWFDEQGVITENQDYFITLGDKNEDGSYKNIALKGGQEAKITYSTFITKYDPDLHDGITEERIKTIMLSDGGSADAPDIEQGGSWVIYYSISADSHETKYGIWKVLIEDPDNYIIIKFVKGLPVQYGDVTGRNLLPDLIKNGCIELSGKIIPNLTALLAYTEAYAYEDVSAEDGIVNGGTSVGRYAIRFMFNEDGKRLYGDAKFKYSTTNEPDSDTNLDKFEVEKRVIDIELGDVKFTYDGERHIPTITLKNFVGGEDVELKDFEIGVPVSVVLSNGDVISVTVAYNGGNEDMTSGSYSLKVTINAPNYRLGENSDIFVTIERPDPENPSIDGKIALPVWAIILIAVGGVALVAAIIIAIVVIKKRKAQTEEDDEGFNDDYTENT